MSCFALNTKERYAESFKIFRERSKELPHLVKMLNVRLGCVLSRLNLSELQQRHQLNVLSVGSGSGEIDIEILKIIRKKLQESEDCGDIKIYNWVVEPNSHLLNLYEAAIKQLPRSWHQEGEGDGEDDGADVDIIETGSGEVIFKLLNTTFEQFKETTAGQKFDIIHFVHSMYYLDVEKALVYCMEKILHQNGFVMCVVLGEDSSPSKIFSKTKSVLNDQCGIPSVTNAERLTERIKKIAEKQKWKCEDHTDEFKFDISEVFDEQSKTGNLLLDFLADKVDFRFSTKEGVVQEILDFIKNVTFVENGKYFGYMVEHIMLIYRDDD